MKNPLRNAWIAHRHWSDLRRFPGVFRRSDAWLQFNRVIFPARCHSWRARRLLPREVTLRAEPDGACEVTVRANGLVFFWPTWPDQNLHFIIEQEYLPRNPHCYTTPPIRLGPESRVIDVGACEGLFAYRLLRDGLARTVTAFEPLPRMADLLARGAERNGLAGRLTLEPMAVGDRSGDALLHAADDPEAARLEWPGASSDSSGAIPIRVVALDDYCRQAGWEPGPSDLIKIDAEGADFDVLRGAERIIREGAPQIAVTTYHADDHASRILDWLSSVQPAYRFRLKGFSFWTPVPRPVLLLASSGSR